MTHRSTALTPGAVATDARMSSAGRVLRRATAGRLPRLRSRGRPSRTFVALSALGLMFATWFFAVLAPRVGSAGYDAFAYWDVHLDDPYGRSFDQLTGFGAFRYSPAIAMVLAPLHALPWPTFFWIFSCLGVGTLIYLARGWTLAALAIPGVAVSLYLGNVDLFLAAFVAIAMVSPAAWAIVILTKPTMVVCLLWFVLRRDWRAAWIALGATAAIAVPSMALRPDLWVSWFQMLGNNATIPVDEWGPVWLRLPIATVVIAVAASTSRPWLVGIAAAICQPVLGLRSMTVALAALAIARRQARAAAAAPVPVPYGADSGASEAAPVPDETSTVAADPPTDIPGGGAADLGQRRPGPALAGDLLPG